MKQNHGVPSTVNMTLEMPSLSFVRTSHKSFNITIDPNGIALNVSSDRSVVIPIPVLMQPSLYVVVLSWESQVIRIRTNRNRRFTKRFIVRSPYDRP